SADSQCLIITCICSFVSIPTPRTPGQTKKSYSVRVASFGKPATAEKWIADAAENAFYQTRAESDGFVFLSTVSISESSSASITLTGSHDSQPQGIVARSLQIPMGLLSNGVAKKALLQDLNDI